jgi:hypothetical protein
MTIKLSDVFSQLTYGELSQISIGGGDTGQIDDSNYEQILAHINLGLTALYKRFPLKEERLTIIRQATRSTYPINSTYAISNTASTEPAKFIDDMIIPFKDDILKIERAYNSDGFEFALNDEGDENSVFTTSATVLRVPATIDPALLTATFELVYRANHPMIKIGDGPFNPAVVTLELPITHLEPLLLYVASRFHGPTGMVNEFNASNNYAAKYERACQEIELQNLRVDQGSQHNRLRDNGWV